MSAGQETEGQRPPEGTRKPQLTALLAKDLDPAKVSSLLSGKANGSGGETIITFQRVNSYTTYIRVVDMPDGSKQIFVRQRIPGEPTSEQNVTDHRMVMGTDALGDPLLMPTEPSSEQ